MKSAMFLKACWDCTNHHYVPVVILSDPSDLEVIVIRNLTDYDSLSFVGLSGTKYSVGSPRI